MEEIDTSFVLTSDAGGGDPDWTSPTLRRYHRLLWSKPLPDGAMLHLPDVYPKGYLHQEAGLGEFWLSRDAVMATYRGYRNTSHIMQLVPAEEHENFGSTAYTIGAMMIFPGNQIDRKWTINQARGVHPRIADRMDLTLECIRRHYAQQPSPMTEVLAR